MRQSSAVYRRRRVVAIAALVAVAAILAFVVLRLAGSDAAEPPSRAGGAERGARAGDPHADPAARAPARRAPDPPRLPRRGLLRRAPGPSARGARDRQARRDGTQARARGEALRAQIAAGAARDGADRGRGRRAPGPGRSLQPAPARLGDPPLPEGGAQGQVAADPRHPARPLGLLHRDQAAAQVAQGARRRARAGPRMADGPGRGAGRRDRQRERTRGQRHDSLAGPARAAPQPARRSCC